MFFSFFMLSIVSIFAPAPSRIVMMARRVPSKSACKRTNFETVLSRSHIFREHNVISPKIEVVFKFTTFYSIKNISLFKAEMKLREQTMSLTMGFTSERVRDEF